MSGRTDVGARVLALAARRVVIDAQFPCMDTGSALAHLRESVLDSARAAVEVLDINRLVDLDATLGMVCATPQGAMAFLFGDGVIAAQTEQGIRTITVSWAGNMPGYPSYLLDQDRLASFLVQSEQAAKEEQRDACAVRYELLNGDGVVLESTSHGLSAEIGILGITSVWTDGGPPVLAVMTDGVGSLGGLGNAVEGEVLASLMKFKGIHGEFVTRRMRRVLSDFLQNNFRPRDDISMAAIARPIPS